MPPLTTPYSGRVVGGGMDAAPTPSSALGPKSVRDRGLTAFSEGPMTHSPRMGLFTYLRYGFGRLYWSRSMRRERFRRIRDAIR